MQSISGNSGGSLPNSVLRPEKLIPKPDQDIIRKVQTNNPHEHSCKSP